MDSSTQGYLQLATTIRQGPPLSKEDLKRVNGKIQLHYQSGAPYFTRQTIHRIGSELAQAAKDNKARVIPLTGIDGVIVEFEVKIETANMAIPEGHEYFAQSARLLYLTPGQLAMFSGSNPITAYSNIQIMIQMASQSNIQSSMDDPSQRSRDGVAEILSHNRQIWEASKQCEQLKRVLAQRSVPKGVRNIIGIGLGALSGGGIQSSASSSAYQHALLLTLQKTLAKPQCQNHIACYVQDPAYSALDKVVLHDSGFTVLEDPNGFVEIDEDSAVISLFPDCPVKEIVFGLAKPALIIWQTVKLQQVEASSSTEQHVPAMTSSDLVADPDGSHVQQCIRTYYDELEFPTDEGNFSDVSIYIKRGDPSFK